MAQGMTPGSGAWEDLRKQARKLENEIDLKLMSFSKLGAGHSTSTLKNEGGDTEPLLSTEDVFETMALDVEQLLAKLTNVNERLAEVFGPEGSMPSSNAALIHTLQRHREILQDYKQEFHKTKTNWRARREREDLLRSVRKDIDTFKTSSGLNRRMDLCLKENDHIRSSDRLVDEQISIAVDTRDNLMSQRFNLKRIQTRVHDLSSRFPAVNSLLQRINIRKRRDSLILGAVIGCCTILMLLYAFH